MVCRMKAHPDDLVSPLLLLGGSSLNTLRFRPSKHEFLLGLGVLDTNIQSVIVT